MNLPKEDINLISNNNKYIINNKKNIISLLKPHIFDIILIFLSIIIFLIGIIQNNNFINYNNLEDAQKIKEKNATISAFGVSMFSFSLNGFIRLMFSDSIWAIKSPITIDCVERLMSGYYSKFDNVIGIYKDKIKIKILHIITLFTALIILSSHLLIQNLFSIVIDFNYNDLSLLLTGPYYPIEDSFYNTIDKNLALYSEAKTINEINEYNSSFVNSSIIWPEILNKPSFSNWYGNNILGVEINIDCNTFIKDNGIPNNNTCSNSTIFYTFPDNKIVTTSKNTILLKYLETENWSEYRFFSGSGGYMCGGAGIASGAYDDGPIYSQAATCNISSNLVIGNISGVNNIYDFNKLSYYNNREHNSFLKKINRGLLSLVYVFITVPQGETTEDAYNRDYDFNNNGLLADVTGLNLLKKANATNETMNNALFFYFQNIILLNLKNGKQDITINTESSYYKIAINKKIVISILVLNILISIICLSIGIYNTLNSRVHRGMKFCSIATVLYNNDIYEEFNNTNNLIIDEILEKVKTVDVIFK